MSANIPSPAERKRLSTIPIYISDAELVRFFALLAEYLTSVDQCVKPAHHLAQVAHICILCWLGWSSVSVDRLPQAALVALCEQMELRTPDRQTEAIAANPSKSWLRLPCQSLVVDRRHRCGS